MVKAVTAPLSRIVQNGGKNSAIVLEHVQEQNFNIGYNAATDSSIVLANVVDGFNSYYRVYECLIALKNILLMHSARYCCS